MVSDTVTIAPTSMARLEITSVAPLVATAIRRNHQGESLADLRATV
jgi:phosphoribosylpyrophosphate synthetase